MSKRASAYLAALVGLVAVVIFCVMLSSSSQSPVALPPTHPTTTVADAVPAKCAEPKTASDYNKMFAKVNPAYWGGADVSISVPWSDGSRIWLYGDTLSTGRFVHSSAIVQKNGCLTVNRRGEQLLPNDSDTLIYWIDSARKVDNTTLYIRAGQISIKPGQGPWAFKATGRYKTATVKYIRGVLTFVTWNKQERNAKPTVYPYSSFSSATNPLSCGVRKTGAQAYLKYPTAAQVCPKVPKNEISYNPQVHNAKLASGKTLMSVCFNNDGPLTSAWANYRPRFFEV